MRPFHKTTHHILPLVGIMVAAGVVFHNLAPHGHLSLKRNREAVHANILHTKTALSKSNPAGCDLFLQQLANPDVHQILLPTGPCAISKQLEINRPLKIEGNGHELRFYGNGSLAINSPDFSMSHVKVLILIDGPNNISGIPILSLRADNAEITKNEFTAEDFPRENDDFKITIPVRIQSTQIMVLGSLDPKVKTSNIRILENKFLNNSNFELSAVDTNSIKNVRTPLEQIELSANRIDYFTGPVFLLNCTNCLIQDNYLFRNRGGNIVVSGTRMRLLYNHILLSGNGSSGDGMAIFDLSNSVISHNLFYRSGCYGMSILGDSHDLRISSNTFMGGITTGLYFGPIGASYSKAVNVTVEQNTFIRNLGWGIAAIGTVGLHIESNVFVGKTTMYFEKNHSLSTARNQSLDFETPNNSEEFKDQLSNARFEDIDDARHLGNY